MWGFPKLGMPFVGGPYNKDYSILSNKGTDICGDYHMRGIFRDCCADPLSHYTLNQSLEQRQVKPETAEQIISSPVEQHPFAIAMCVEPCSACLRAQNQKRFDMEFWNSSASQAIQPNVEA